MHQFFIVKIQPGPLLKTWKSWKELRQSRLGFQAANSHPELQPELQQLGLQTYKGEDTLFGGTRKRTLLELCLGLWLQLSQCLQSIHNGR